MNSTIRILAFLLFALAVAAPAVTAAPSHKYKRATPIPRVGNRDTKFKVKYFTKVTVRGGRRYYQVEMSRVGKGFSKKCSQFGYDLISKRVKRHRTITFTLSPYTSKRAHRWCKGRYTGAVSIFEEGKDPCRGDQICRDSPENLKRVVSRFHLRVR